MATTRRVRGIMRSWVAGILVLICAAAFAGCARRTTATDASFPHVAAPTTNPSTAPADSQTVDPRAMLALDEIEPRPTLPQPAIMPSGADAEAPLEAIELFARARDARSRNQPYSAINDLERAIRLDPHSFELHFSLGGLYHRVGNTDKAIQSYERAAAIKPDELALQAELGRAHMQRGNVEQGIAHLRLARQTQEYTADPGAAAAVDYRLGLALQQGGYDRAALEVYERLFRRLREQTATLRTHPEVAYLMNRPEFLLEQVGRLYEKHGQYDEAMSAWAFIAKRQPEDFQAQARVVTTLQSMRRTNEALHGAAELVRRFRASPESLALLRDVHRNAGRQESLVDELRHLHESRPQDRVVLFALADAMEAVGRTAQAEQLLAGAAEQRQGDVEITWRLADLLIERNQLERAARSLIETTARRPHTTTELLPLWGRLSSPGRKEALRVDDLRRIDVAPNAEAAKLYYLWHVGRAWNRQWVARRALEQSAAARPLFPPAMRAMLDDIWTEANFDAAEKEQRSQAMIDAARHAGDDALASELEGAAALARRDYDSATRLFDEALRNTRQDEQTPAPDLLMSQAVAERAKENFQRYEQLAWRLISDHSRYEPVYGALFRHYMERGNANAARNLLGTWLANLPESVEARLLEATVQLRMQNQREQAEQTLLVILRQHADRPDVLANVRSLYAEQNQLDRFAELLEAELSARPHNYAAVAQLVDIYASQKRLPEAARVLDAARAALSGDPDRLYFIAHLYHRIEQPRQSEDVLEQILRIDPDFAPAGNDLGYTWADDGRNLRRAEELIRRALQVEPDNPMYLDSLGWVLYKQGRLDESQRYLQQAVADPRAADPVILDHLGDVLYRLDRAEQANRHWRAALERIAGTGAEQHNTLRLQLDQKLRQMERGEPVSVAPIGETRALSGRAEP